MQLQGTMPGEWEHITKQHGGTVFTEEITHYAAVSHKKIFQLHFFIAFVDTQLPENESKWLLGFEH